MAIFLSNCVGSLCPSGVFLKFGKTLFKVKLKASPSLTNPAVGDKGGNHVCWKVSFCVFTSRMAFSLNSYAFVDNCVLKQCLSEFRW